MNLIKFTTTEDGRMLVINSDAIIGRSTASVHTPERNGKRYLAMRNPEKPLCVIPAQGTLKVTGNQLKSIRVLAAKSGAIIQEKL